MTWEGGLAGGDGALSEDSGVLSDAPVTWASRVQSPEELIASAHATCYAMSLSNALAESDTPPERLEVDAVCVLDDEELKITAVDLDVRGSVPGIDNARFERPPGRPSSSAPSRTP